jgi:hypothetical protein
MGGLCLGVVLSATAQVVPVTPETGYGAVLGSIMELRSQDQALSLAVEAFRQAQIAAIERDFGEHIQQARRSRDRDAQYATEVFAEFQRFWRYRRLGTQVRNLLLAYEYARRSDVRRLGLPVPSAVDLERAARQVRELIPRNPISVETPVFECLAMTQCDVLFADLQLVVPGGRMAPSTTVGRVFARYGEHLATLHEINGGDEQLLNAVMSCLSESNALAPTVSGPTVMATTLRRGPRGLHQVCVQTIARTAPAGAGLTELPGPSVAPPSQAFVRDLAADWFELLNSPEQQWFGAPTQVKVRQRAYQHLLEGDLTFFREQTVEPLFVMATLPQPQRYLPASLRKRVTAVALEADFNLTEWRVKVHFLTASADDAERLAHTLGAWREMLLTTLQTRGEDELRVTLTEAVRRARLEVGERSVVLHALVPARVATRSTQRALRWAATELP